jgi:tetratricopeptide (TPR) repeat protein
MKKIHLMTSFILLLALVCGAAHASTAEQDYRQANKLFAKGKYSEAILLYRSVLADPTRRFSTGVLHTRIADSYFQLQEYRNARDAYRRALTAQKESERPATQYWIGFSTFLMGRNAEALSEFLKVPELYPDSGMWVSTAYYWAGRVCERMGEKKLAADYFRKAGGSGRSSQGKFALKKAEKMK